jgi:hypothetical protein
MSVPTATKITKFPWPEGRRVRKETGTEQVMQVHW